MQTPESVWGYELLSSNYGEEPERSAERIVSRMRELYPGADDKTVRREAL